MNVFLVCGAFLVFSLGFADANCPNGWTGHDDFCFHFMKETYNWFDAKFTCQSMGGYLAEDTTNSRHEMMKGLIQTHGATSGLTWIGLQDFAEENLFVWDHSGESVEHYFWGPTEPQDAGGEEDCVALHNGLWADLNCEDRHVHFICEKPADEEETGGLIG